MESRDDRDSPGGTDGRRAIRDFLATRRARITPDQAGIPLYGVRPRVPGLRREEVATLAGVSTDYYVRVEKGSLAGVSDDVLNAVARALQFDQAERVHLFNLVRANRSSRTGRARSTAPRRRARHGDPPKVTTE